MSTMKPEQPLPCPFCGAKASRHKDDQPGSRWEYHCPHGHTGYLRMKEWNNRAQPAQAGDVDSLMAQAQVFASAWSLVGGKFDSGDAIENAEKANAELRTMITRALSGEKAGPVGGVALIAAERSRQTNAEGWSHAHDAEHADGELARAAACYAMTPGYSMREHTPPLAWPWDESWWKPGDRLRELAKAGALIAAEIDRLLPASPTPDKEG